MGETIDDALATRCSGTASLEPFEGEGRTGTVAQKTLEPRSVPRRDSYCLYEEGLEVVLDQRIERCLDGTPSPVDGPTVRRRRRTGRV